MEPPNCLLIIFILLAAPCALCAESPADRAAVYMESVRRDPLLLRAFLQEMPKGADLHNHLEGSIYAETLIGFAARDGLCIDRSEHSVVAAPCDARAGRPPASAALQDTLFYGELIDAFSMRNWSSGRDSAQDHFFAAFSRFRAAARPHPAEMVAEEMARAASQRLQYLEIMHLPDRGEAAKLGAAAGWNGDAAAAREKLLAAGIAQLVMSTRRILDDTETQVRSQLKCGTPQAAPGCQVTVRYLYPALRGLPPEQVFAQLLFAFELSQADRRVVGVNLVMAEHWPVPMRDFDLHMRMLRYLHSLYPKIHISLHAGELAFGQVPPEGLRFHIRKSIEEGSAERIGHGVDVMYEDRPLDLLREMAKRKTLVEICLTSNDWILGIRGAAHPLPLYLRYGVPVALATDDQGVSRSDITAEYVRAVEIYGLRYPQLKQVARQSLEHSFLDAGERAQEQRRLEAAFAAFERAIVRP